MSAQMSRSPASVTLHSTFSRRKVTNYPHVCTRAGQARPPTTETRRQQRSLGCLPILHCRCQYMPHCTRYKGVNTEQRQVSAVAKSLRDTSGYFIDGMNCIVHDTTSIYLMQSDWHARLRQAQQRPHTGRCPCLVEQAAHIATIACRALHGRIGNIGTR